MLMPSRLRVESTGVGVKLGVKVNGRVGKTLGTTVLVDVGAGVLVSLGLGVVVGTTAVMVGFVIFCTSA
jgi:hypothetical protein